MVNLNVMVFFTSSCNAKSKNNVEGLLKKRAATHIQRKNCGSRNTENKQTNKKKNKKNPKKTTTRTLGWMGTLLGI